jgi:hypothetical protein
VVRRQWRPVFQNREGLASTYGLIVRSYTSRIALITVSGSSNCIYSELCIAKICFAFDDCAMKRPWAAVISFSYFRCFGVSGGFSARWPTPWFPLV